ncbi:MAG: 4-alpha-glucanotransferase [Lachnospiraceae bacterium]|nr:4-alpha-glucanotransferase [Lachnospiraceae bacterium]
MKRSSGILMPISSLPGKYGIGTLGREAYLFADFLNQAGQSCWQILPAGPTTIGDSPYQSFSSYAGNPYFIDPDILCEEGLLTEEECRETETIFRNTAQAVDYGLLYATRFELLKKASDRAASLYKAEIERFVSENQWADGYARFMALKRANGMKGLDEWTMRTFSEEMTDDYRLFVFIQFAFDRQWKKFKAYVNSQGIKLFGDVPIYVSYDSADVWQEPGQFLLDENYVPEKVSGVPPDYFSKDGQLWGNPLYNYERMADDGYSWWINRIGRAAELYDMIRIDHFRGFASYWAVPYGAKTAKEGSWVKGPGMDLVSTLTNWFSGTEFIAEDLGEATPDVKELLDESGLPGMKVLQFAFESDCNNPHLPHNHTPNSVCYTGTHDNATLAEWIRINPKERILAEKYAGLNREEGYAEGLIRLGMSSVSELFVAPMADWLGLDEEARINTPGTAYGNWQWRMQDGYERNSLAERICSLTDIFGRKRNV